MSKWFLEILSYIARPRPVDTYTNSNNINLPYVLIHSYLRSSSPKYIVLTRNLFKYINQGQGSEINHTTCSTTVCIKVLCNKYLFGWLTMQIFWLRAFALLGAIRIDCFATNIM